MRKKIDVPFILLADLKATPFQTWNSELMVNHGCQE